MINVGKVGSHCAERLTGGVSICTLLTGGKPHLHHFSDRWGVHLHNI
jgi:hypothetical protein